MAESDYRDMGLAVIDTEIDALQAMRDRIDDSFDQACAIMGSCQGRIIVTGMGKSGHIAGKIAATLASTGSPAFFVHPGEASHGDLGMITDKDVVLALSNSGSTHELLTIVPIIKRLGIPLISMTGKAESPLATEADVNLDISVDKEACPHGLAPTSSTTASLVLGDALAIALLQAKGFSAEDFALSHPGGTLGRRLLLHIADIMHTGDDVPAVSEDASAKEALLEMSLKGLGMTAIIDQDHKVLGIFTDGDLRRTLEKTVSVQDVAISDVMTAGCKTVKANELAAEVVKQMEDFRINAVLVVDDDDRLVGALNMQTLLRAGVV